MKKNPVETVLLAVLKDKKDLAILKRNSWYRIPLAYKPKRKTGYIAFYQPSSFEKSGSCIRYFARVKDNKIAKRKKLLPEEPLHARANNNYCKITFDKVSKLKKPITNKNRLRVSFGFTTLTKLLKAKEVIELFDVPPIEKILSEALQKENLPFRKQHIVRLPNDKKYILDFAIFCKTAKLNIECDGEKWHSLRSQRIKDNIRDRRLRKAGWKVLRLTGNEIVNDTRSCINKIHQKIKNLSCLNLLPT